MDVAALAGLIGALIGGLTTLAGSALTSRLQAGQESTKWARDRKATAYDSTVRYLLRAANRRSSLGPGGTGAFIAKEHIREFFDDLVEAQYWLAVLTTVCGEGQRQKLTQASTDFDLFVAALGSEGVAALARDKRTHGELPVSEFLGIVVGCSREEFIQSTGW